MAIKYLKNIIDRAFLSHRDHSAITDISITKQFDPSPTTTDQALQSLNAAMLICLGPENHPLYSASREFLATITPSGLPDDVVKFYRLGPELIKDEIQKRTKYDPRFCVLLQKVSCRLDARSRGPGTEGVQRGIWEVFFPEGATLAGGKDTHVKRLRDKRRVTVRRLNPKPIDQPGDQILFTANVLLTTPMSDKHEDLHCLHPQLVEAALQATEEPQRYWYDHPIPAGIAPEKNEVVYGLRGLDQAVAYEKNRGTVAKGARVSCALSISVTHDGLQAIARPIVMEMIRSAGKLGNLEVSLWTERETEALVREILAPASKYFFGVDAEDELSRVIGVNGEYGRHYSFLRALAVLWEVCLSPGLKGTFKIDLDQVFPQEQLVAETGCSAFEHFKTPLWGADGVDSKGRPVHLGMIAGALVNYEDAQISLFTPDVKYPQDRPKADEVVFFSRLPQAISTEAEMMTRYGRYDLAPNECIQRIHVTGGTCGILVEALKRYKPFTPTFVSRAEDQAYLLSVLFQNNHGFLRYVHKDGLIMRHDKEAFAREAIRLAETGKFVGDLARVLVFSYYADALPWEKNEIKGDIDPFTGCFVSLLPITVTYLRLVLRAAFLFQGGKKAQARELIETAAARLVPIVEHIKISRVPFRDAFEVEKVAWDIYYRTLEQIRDGLRRGEPKAVWFAKRGRELINSTKVK